MKRGAKCAPYFEKFDIFLDNAVYFDMLDFFRLESIA